MFTLIFKFPLTGKQLLENVDSFDSVPQKEDVIQIDGVFCRVDCRVISYFKVPVDGRGAILHAHKVHSVTLRVYQCQDPGINDKKQ